MRHGAWEWLVGDYFYLNRRTNGFSQRGNEGRNNGPDKLSTDY